MKRGVYAVIAAAVLLFAVVAWAGDEDGSTIKFGSGAGNSCSDNGSSFFGYYAGYTTTGSLNTFVGAEAGYTNTSGADSVYVGYRAGYSNQDGTFNNFIGSKAGFSNTTGDDNIFIGLETGYKNQSGGFNVFIGSGAGHENVSGGNNTLVGYQAGLYSTGSGNVFIGNRAGWAETSSNRLYISNSDTSSPLIYGEFDNQLVRINGTLHARGLTISTGDGVRFANGTIQTSAGLTGTSTSEITALGSGAGGTGNYSVFFGPEAGAHNTGGYNSFIGYYSGFYNTTGDLNTFVGNNAGVSNTTGSSNSFFGYRVGIDNTTGSHNSFFGYVAGSSNDSGSWNTALGTYAGAGGTESSGTNNVFIGAGAGYGETGSNKLYIDNCSNRTFPCTSNPLIYGEFDNRTVQINGKLVFASDERLKTDVEPLAAALEKILNLKGVNYAWKDKGRSGQGREMGFLAQDVEKVFPELVHTDSKGLKSLSYDRLAPALVEAIREQQKIIENQNNTIGKLTERLSKLEKLEAGIKERECKSRPGQK